MSEMKDIAIDKIVFAEDFNPRTELGDLSDLVASIQSVGVREPILVKDRENAEGEVEVFAGFRRLAASREAGQKTVPCLVHPRRSITRQMMLMLNMTENVHREDLNPVDEARGYEKLQKEHGMTPDEISEKLGVKKGRVTQRMRLLKLSDVVKEAVLYGKITVKAALEIDRLPKERQGKFVTTAEDLQGARLKALVDKELEKIHKAADRPEKTEAAPADSAAVTELVRGIKKSGAVMCNGLGCEQEEAERFKSVNWRLLEIDDLKSVATVLDKCADAVPDDIDVNDKAEAEITEIVGGRKGFELDVESPVVRHALIASIRARAIQIAAEKAVDGKRPRVTFAIAEEAIAEFFDAVESSDD